MFCVIFDFDGPIFDGRIASQDALKSAVDNIADPTIKNTNIDLSGVPLSTPEVLIKRFFYEASNDMQTIILQNYETKLDFYEKELAIDQNILEILKLLKQNKNISTILFTNRKEKNILSLLETQGIAKYFNNVFGRDTVSPKPSIETIDKIKKDYDVECEDMVFIGDSDSDYYCAFNSGISYYHTKYSDEPSNLSWKKADYVINNTLELISIFKNFELQNHLIDPTSLPRELESAINAKRFSMYCGAGVSVPSDIGKWDEEYKMVFDKLGLTHFFYFGDLPEALQLAIADKTRALSIFDEFRHQFEVGNKKFPNEYHYAILNSNASTIWTTNYDFLFDFTITKENLKIKVVRDDDELLQNSGYNYLLIKMNGDFERAKYDDSGSWNLTFTQEQFDLFEVEKHEIANKFEIEYKNNSFIFIGISFTDPALKRMLSIIKRKSFRTSFPHYFLAKREYDPVKQYFQDLHINKLKSYGISTLLFSNYDYILKFAETVAVHSSIQNIAFSGNLADEIKEDEKHHHSLFTAKETEAFCRKTAYKLAQKKYKVISGCAPWIGIPAVEGAFEINNKLGLYYLRRGGGTKFKANAPAMVIATDSYTDMRKEFITNSNLLIALSGRIYKEENSGVLEEINIAVKNNIPVIYIPQFGGIVEKYYDKISIDIQNNYENSSIKDAVIEVNKKIRNFDKEHFNIYSNNELLDDIDDLLCITKGNIISTHLC